MARPPSSDVQPKPQEAEKAAPAVLTSEQAPHRLLKKGKEAQIGI